MYLLCTLIILFMVIILMKSIKFHQNYIMYFFLGIYILLFWIIPIIKYDFANDLIIKVTSSTFAVPHSQNIMYYSLISFIFIFIFIITYTIFTLMIFKKKVMKNNAIKNNSLNMSDHKKIMLLSLLGAVGMVFFSGLSIQQLLTGNRFDFFSTSNNYMMLVATYLTYLFSVSCFLVGTNKMKVDFLFIFTLCVNVLVIMFVFGSRSQIIAFAFAFLIGKIKNETKFKWKYMFLAVLFTHFFVIWQYVRYNIKSVEGIKELIVLIFYKNKDAYLLSINNGDLSYFYDITFVAMYIRDSLGLHLNGDTYIRLLLLLFPSSIVPIKPEETQRVFASIINPQLYVQGATYPPSILGDMYLNFGFLGWIIAIFIGIVIAWFQYRINNYDDMLSIGIASNALIFILLLIRGTFNGLYPMIFCCFILYIMYIAKLLFKKGNFG